ncbi:diadenylate cyclase CdaA [Entomospira entomophila]|uniref:Diadenylate cyclase n=1 Tax=Entomospira entomophila TaxID=2719988 RepID=A0A968GBD1_9SPIO|nr:diadenylate cyclase CdaA [Entomospira entomophilus]NIZ40508.1 TIGR00159 family protein [Entomospira entomophilus]WDI36067.1 diadenylate cyclase CdaA [Entomospira entomophilus]
MDNWLNNTWLFSEIIRPFLDITILAVVFYQIYRHVIKSYGQYIAKALRGPITVFLIAYIFQLKTILWLYQLMSPFLVIAVAIVFQPELRKMLAKIGRKGWIAAEQQASAEKIEMIFSALQALSERERGALIVFSRSLALRNVIETGTRLDAELSGALIMTIFEHDTLLHDGALVVHNGRCVAAGCFLSLSKQENLRKSFGTRHRAALGVTEESDAVVLVLSEESGALSLAVDGVLYYDRSIDELKIFLRSLLTSQSAVSQSTESERIRPLNDID